jgi:hypothetical protein
MKIGKETARELANWDGRATAGVFNCMTLTGLSFLWAHFLNMISPWFIPLTIILLCVGFSQEVKQPEKPLVL